MGWCRFVYDRQLWFEPDSVSDHHDRSDGRCVLYCRRFQCWEQLYGEDMQYGGDVCLLERWFLHGKFDSGCQRLYHAMSIHFMELLGRDRCLHGGSPVERAELHRGDRDAMPECRDLRLCQCVALYGHDYARQQW